MIGGVVGRLRILIGGENADLDRALARAEKGIAAFGKRVASIGAIGSALGLSAAAIALGRFTMQSLEVVDAQAELAYRVGGTVAAVQVLADVGKKAGVPIEMLGQAAGRMNQRLAEVARTGEGPAADALKRVGLSAQDLLKLDVDERLAVLADRFDQLGLTAAQQGDVLKQFGIRNQEVINLLEGGGEAIRKVRQELVDYGIAVSEIDAAQIGKANDALDDTKKALTGIGVQLSRALAPFITEVAGGFNAAARESKGFGEAIELSVLSGAKAIAKFKYEIQDLRIKFDEEGGSILDGFDTVAGFIPKAIERATKGAITAADLGFRPLGHSWGKLREQLGPPPNEQEWDRYFGLIKLKYAMLAAEAVKGRGGAGGKGDPALTERQKQLADQFAAFKGSLANEAAALDVHRQQEETKRKEFQDAQVGGLAEHEALKLAIRERFNNATDELVYSRLEQGVATELEQLEKKNADQYQLLEKFEVARSDQAARWGAIRVRLAEKEENDKRLLYARSYAVIAGNVDQAMNSITQIIGQQGDKQFWLIKAISTATALVKGYEAVVAAWTAGNLTGIPGMGEAYAATTAAAVAAQIGAMHAVQPGSGGGMPSAGAGGGVPAAAPTGGGQASAMGGGNQTLFVRGLDAKHLYSGRAMRDLAEALIKYQKNGGTVVVA